MIRNLKIRCLAAAIVAGCAATASAAVWDESVNGDVSGDRAAPSVATLAFGDNLVKGTPRAATSTTLRSRYPPA